MGTVRGIDALVSYRKETHSRKSIQDIFQL